MGGHSTKSASRDELESLKPFATAKELECLDALIEHGSYRRAAAALGRSDGAISSSLSYVRARATEHGWSPMQRHGWRTHVPEGVPRRLSPIVEAMRAESVAPPRAPVADRTYVERPAARVLDGLPLSNGRTTFVISDMHAPYHDPIVWATKLAIIKLLRPEVVVIVGDFFDFYAASFFPKNPTRRARLIDEIEEGLPLLDQLEALRVPNVFYLQGNHEERLDRAIVSMAPALHGMVRTLPEIARIAERGWHWVPYKRSISIGKMRYSHDFTRCGVNAARQSLLDVGKSITFGHTHRLGVAYQGTVEDGSHVALNVGHGSDLSQVDYMHRDRALRDWQHGCGIVDEDERGFVWPQAVAIIEGTARVRGQKVAA
jgi:predicted phosphodiesterase